MNRQRIARAEVCNNLVLLCRIIRRIMKVTMKEEEEREDEEEEMLEEEKKK